MDKKIKYKGAELIYSDRGEGKCIVLLHGYLESGAVWESFTGRFPGGFRFIIPDLPGHGKSGSWGKVHTMDELAEAIKAILDREGIQKIFLAGHSMGGYVTMAFADPGDRVLVPTQVAATGAPAIPIDIVAGSVRSPEPARRADPFAGDPFEGFFGRRRGRGMFRPARRGWPGTRTRPA